ncbi:MAG: ATP-binding protein [Roseiflexaceae bacterium]
MSRDVSALADRDPDGHLRCIDPLRDRPVWMAGAPSETGAPSAMLVEPICALCKGVRWIKEAVPFGHPHFGVLFPCSCLQAEWAHRTALELARLSNLAAMRDKTFATFNPFVPGLREVVPRIRAYAGKPDGWLTLLGPYGTGKTHLAAAIANEVLNREEQVLFAVVPDLLDHLRATFGPQSTVAYDERFESVRSVPLLILDDLGTESATAWAREKLYQVINHRYNYRLATVITTNLKPEAIEPRIYSRLCDPACGAIMTIIAQDYRRRSAQGIGHSHVVPER